MGKNNVMGAVSLTPDRKARFESFAGSRGMTLSKMFREAANFYMEFDFDLFCMLKVVSQDTGLPMGNIIERYCLAFMAELEAEDRVSGGRINKAMIELAPGMNALEFYNFWLKMSIQELSDNLQKQADIDSKEEVVPKYWKSK